MCDGTAHTGLQAQESILMELRGLGAPRDACRECTGALRRRVPLLGCEIRAGVWPQEWSVLLVPVAAMVAVSRGLTVPNCVLEWLPASLIALRQKGLEKVSSGLVGGSRRGLVLSPGGLLCSSKACRPLRAALAWLDPCQALTHSCAPHLGFLTKAK